MNSALRAKEIIAKMQEVNEYYAKSDYIHEIIQWINSGGEIFIKHDSMYHSLTTVGRSNYAQLRATVKDSLCKSANDMKRQGDTAFATAMSDIRGDEINE